MTDKNRPQQHLFDYYSANSSTNLSDVNNNYNEYNNMDLVINNISFQGTTGLTPEQIRIRANNIDKLADKLQAKSDRLDDRAEDLREAGKINQARILEKRSDNLAVRSDKRDDQAQKLLNSVDNRYNLERAKLLDAKADRLKANADRLDDRAEKLEDTGKIHQARALENRADKLERLSDKLDDRAELLVHDVNKEYDIHKQNIMDSIADKLDARADKLDDKADLLRDKGKIHQSIRLDAQADMLRNQADELDDKLFIKNSDTPPSTDAIGEEDNGDSDTPPSTEAIGEEDNGDSDIPPSTDAIGEEDNGGNNQCQVNTEIIDCKIVITNSDCSVSETTRDTPECAGTQNPENGEICPPDQGSPVSEPSGFLILATAMFILGLYKKFFSKL